MTLTLRPILGKRCGLIAPRAALVALSLLLALPATAQGVDPADVTFWQSIQSSGNAAEYQAYLDAFPNGIFAELAQLRLRQLGGAEQQGEAANTTILPVGPKRPEVPVETSKMIDSGVEITIQPEAPKLGDSITAMATNVPQSTSSDMFIVVPAGSPDTAGISNSQGVLNSIYSSNQYYLDNGWVVGQLAPGAYEIRWLTALYNNDQPRRLELAARTEFEVSR